MFSISCQNGNCQREPKIFIYFKIKIFIDAIRSSVFPITLTAMLSTISTVKVECGIFHKK